MANNTPDVSVNLDYGAGPRPAEMPLSSRTPAPAPESAQIPTRLEMDLPPTPAYKVPSDLSTPGSSAVLPANTADLEHHGFLGRMVRGMFTNENISYERDDTGKLVETRTPQKPGQLFRSILAGALLGGAMGAQDQTHTFAGGFVSGAAGVQKDRERQDQLKRQQADTDYQERLKGQESARKERELSMQEKESVEKTKHYQTLSALNQIQTLGLQQSLLHTDFTHHMNAEKEEASLLKTLESNGIPAFAKNMSSAQIMEFMNTHQKDAVKYKAIISGTEMVTDPKTGQTSWENRFNIYDLQDKKITLSPSLIKDWEDVGAVPAYMGESFKELKKKREINGNDLLSFVSINDAARTKRNEEANEKAKLGEMDSVTKRNMGEYYHSMAQANALNQNAAEKKENDDANNELIKNNYDISKVSGKHRITLSKQAQTFAGVLGNELKEINTEKAKLAELGKTDPALDQRQKEVWSQLEAYNDIMKSPFLRPEAPIDTEKLPGPPKAGLAINSEEGKKVYSIFFKAAGNNNAKAAAAMIQKGWGPPEAAPPPPPPPKGSFGDLGRTIFPPANPKQAQQVLSAPFEPPI